jgi:hypothetical protein
MTKVKSSYLVLSEELRFMVYVVEQGDNKNAKRNFQGDRT